MSVMFFCNFPRHAQLFGRYWGCSQMCAQSMKCRSAIILNQAREFRIGEFVHICLPDNFMQSEYLPICSTSLLKV